MRTQIVKFAPTPKQKQLLDYLTKYIKKHGIAPTLEQMATERNVSLPAIVQMLQRLERRGLIARIKHSKGAISVPGVDPNKVEDVEDDKPSMLNS